MRVSDNAKVPSGANGSVLRLVLTFLLILGGLNLAYYLQKKLALGLVDDPYTQLVTLASGAVSSLVLPYPIETIGKVIIADGNVSLFIASGCNGLEAIFLIIAGIFAYPATWSQRWRGLARYAPLLYLLNLVRVVSLVHVAHSYPEYMDVSHFQIAQGVLIVFVLFFWVHFMQGVAKTTEDRAVEAAGLEQ